MLTLLEVTTTGCTTVTVQGVPGMPNHSLQCRLVDALLTYKSSNNGVYCPVTMIPCCCCCPILWNEQDILTH